MCRNRFIILFVLGLLMVTGTKAQENLKYFFRHITQSDGLLHNEVYSIVQDGKGFIWLATPNGLQRYDGSRFVYYSEMLSNAGERITAGIEMYVDKKRNLLWITNNNDLEKMNLGTNQFTFYEHARLLNDPDFSFSSLHDENSRQWLLGSNAVYHYDSTTKTNVQAQLNIFPANTPHSSYIASDSTDNVTWVANYTKLYLCDKKTKKVYSDKFNPLHHPLLDSSQGNAGRLLRFVMLDSRKNIWITGWSDILYKYDSKTRKINRYSLSAIKAKEGDGRGPVARPLVNCVLEDDNHTVWVGTENAGLLRYNEEKDNFDYCIAQEKNSEGIQYDYKIFNLFQDKEQNIWVGTDKGISIFNPYRQYFKSIRYERNSPSSIGKSEIISFTQTTNGDMFIGTWGGGVAQYDSRFNFKRNILLKELTGTAHNDDVRKVWSFRQVDDKTLWMGCQHGRILIYDLVTGSVQSIQPPEMEESTIRCMEKDDKGNLWFGLHNGKISKWDKKQNKFFSYGTGLQDRLKLAPTVINIFIDRSQHCWVSTIAGFREFDMEKRIYVNTWLPDKNNANSISGKTCQGIAEYNDSILLIGTAYGGINFFNKKTHSFLKVGTPEGLPSNTIFAIKKGTAGYIWFTTDYGLYKFNPVEGKIISYSMDPGVIRSSFISNSFYPLQDGQWLTFTVAEAISFFPRKVEYQDNRQPQIEITGFKLFNKPVSIDSLLFENKPVRLSYKENFFTVEFAALNFSSLHKANYYYRLSGIDKNWVHGGTNRFANYTDLQPGEYVFEVRAENGNTSGTITSFKIIIIPPFWKTWWFIAIIFLFILSLIYLFIKWREKNIKVIEAEKLKVQQLNADQYKSKLELEQIISKAKLEALRAQMNPHFIFNCLASIDNLIQMDEKEKATLYLSKFAKLIRSILENSTHDVVACWKDMEALQLYLELEALRFDNKFSYKVNIAKEILNGDYVVPPLVVQPFVENAIHHGLLNKIEHDKKLLIDVSIYNSHIHYRIEDNGVGRVKSASYKLINKPAHESMGMQITADRINLFNQHRNGSVKITDLYDEQGNAVGTKVEVDIFNQHN